MKTGPNGRGLELEQVGHFVPGIAFVIEQMNDRTHAFGQRFNRFPQLTDGTLIERTIFSRLERKVARGNRRSTTVPTGDIVTTVDSNTQQPSFEMFRPCEVGLVLGEPYEDVLIDFFGIEFRSRLSEGDPPYRTTPDFHSLLDEGFRPERAMVVGRGLIVLSHRFHLLPPKR